MGVLAQMTPLQVRAVPWSCTVANILQSAVGHDDIEDLRQCVEQGATLYAVFDDEGHIRGAYILRIEATATGREGVIVAGAGRINGGSIAAACLPLMEDQLRASGAVRVRVHVSAPAMERMMGLAGYARREIVLSKGL
jgi:hypothetical protein